ncbi:aminotransferase class IV family protein [Clostridium sp. 19966]|uniref:aminotransferase class IV n=1 Tax=Clostridium sp. 19966 TaxID=2768166 RepID=UPI0028DE6B0F|nr:aminotransferase class IV [Clostridium sp. 19966]MDT8716687.1 aminotransferase class IV family protein [Clostridium sp. 19966]
MSECFSEYYIDNGEIKEKIEFKDDFIKKGKSVYEVIRIKDGIPLFLEEHLNRLSNSLKLVSKPMISNENNIKRDMEKLIIKLKVKEGNIKLVFNYEAEDHEYIYMIKHNYPAPKVYEKGVDTIFYHGERDNPNAKVINSSFREKVNDEIEKNRAFEAILVDNNGFMTEGSKSNIFMVSNGTVITSPVSQVLPGVTRGVIIDLLKEAGISFRETQVHYTNIGELDGLFISGTSPKVLPIGKIEEKRFNSASNDIINKIMILYDKKIQEYIDNYSGTSNK